MPDRRFLIFALLLSMFMAACRQPAALAVQVAVTSAPTMTVNATVPPPEITLLDTPTLVPSTPTPTATATVTPLPTETPTPDPYAGLTIADLGARNYGGGPLQVVETIHVTDAFTRTLVRYPSDGLNVYGFMNVPFGEGPFPVALVLHGYIPPEQYGTIAYTTRYADWLARAGYLVIHPNYRNHPPSDTTETFEGGRQTHDFRIGYAVDVLNLIGVLQEYGGQPGALAQALPDQLHLLGHSMGGGITLRVITVFPEVRAAVLYGAMSGDEYKNYERIRMWSNGEVGEAELATPPDVMQRISPIHHLARIQAAVGIHHGDLDDIVPPEWSTELCLLLQQAGKTVECFTYPEQPHTFHDDGDLLFIQRVIDFFSRY